MKTKDIERISVGDYIIDSEALDSYEVKRKKKYGVLVRHIWTNFAGTFYENTFVPYDDLRTDNYELVH